MKNQQINHFKQLELERIQTAMSLQRMASADTDDPLKEQHQQRLQLKLERIEKAFQRLTNGNEYGTCQSCKQRISEERLEVMPYAEMCIACQRGLERQVFPSVQRYQYTYQ